MGSNEGADDATLEKSARLNSLCAKVGRQYVCRATATGRKLPIRIEWDKCQPARRRKETLFQSASETRSQVLMEETVAALRVVLRFVQDHFVSGRPARSRYPRSPIMDLERPHGLRARYASNSPMTTFPVVSPNRDL